MSQMHAQLYISDFQNLIQLPIDECSSHKVYLWIGKKICVSKVEKILNSTRLLGKNWNKKIVEARY